MTDKLSDDILEAKRAVEQAERAVDSLLSKIKGAPRAEKVAVSEPLETALQRLHDARSILASLPIDDG